jgi:pimeloyl-ACP methyl ester carboxylesterase
MQLKFILVAVVATPVVGWGLLVFGPFIGILTLLSWVIGFILIGPRNYFHVDIKRMGSTGAILRSHDIEYEEIGVRTLDDRLISLFDLKPVKDAPERGSIILAHGLSESSFVFVMLGAHSLPMLLRNAGYHVFLLNNRLNSYSRRLENKVKASLSENASAGKQSAEKKRKSRWHFSMTEKGQFDALAAICAVRAITGVAKVDWIGHSEGTAQLYVALSTFRGGKMTIPMTIGATTDINGDEEDGDATPKVTRRKGGKKGRKRVALHAPVSGSGSGRGGGSTEVGEETLSLSSFSSRWQPPQDGDDATIRMKCGGDIECLDGEAWRELLQAFTTDAQASTGIASSLRRIVALGSPTLSTFERTFLLRLLKRCISERVVRHLPAVPSGVEFQKLRKYAPPGLAAWIMYRLNVWLFDWRNTGHYAYADLPRLYCGFPDSTSLHSLLHWSLNANRGSFADMQGTHFTHVRDERSLDLLCINGSMDAQVSLPHLEDWLPEHVEMYNVAGFDHMDYLFSSRAPKEVYEKMLSFFLQEH